MMICPKCGARYDDDTMRFCLDDGTPLIGSAPGDSPTIAFADEETVVVPKPFRSDPGRISQPAEPRKSKTGVTILLTALVMLAIFAIAGAGAWFYFKGTNAQNTNNTVPLLSAGEGGIGNSRPNTRPSPSATANSWSNASPTPAAPVNEEEIKREVAKTINTWRAMAESHDLDSYIGNYADTVDYYRKTGATKAFVRASKQQAFDKFSSLKSDISNMDIRVAPSGREATVQFDKEWNFEGETRSSGKVRQEMRLIFVNGAWLIAAERDLKVYYTN